MIVQALDGVAERQWLHPVRESWVAVTTTVGFARVGWTRPGSPATT